MNRARRAAVSAQLVLIVALASCATAGTPSGSAPAPAATASPTASSQPTGTESIQPVPTVSADPSAGAGADYSANSMVRALVAGISLRAAPSVDSERLGSLPLGSRSLVVGAPREADGYRWIQISGPGLPPASGCATSPARRAHMPRLAWLGSDRRSRVGHEVVRRRSQRLPRSRGGCASIHDARGL